jgi:hypothetical protein
MKNSFILMFVMFFMVGTASADVLVPESEFLGYFDSNGIYTVVGAVKNTENMPVLPTITITAHDGKNSVTVSQLLPTIFPNKDIPFKIKLHQIEGSNVVLEKPTVNFKNELKTLPDIEVLYDRTMTKHRDGHLSGKIINTGNQTEYNIKVYATIHGDAGLIDTGQNIEKIAKIEPGQTADFTIYPDPSLASEVNYYSCFAIGDETIVPLFALRGGEKFKFRYDSTASFTVAGFDESGTILSLDGINSFKIPTYVNFEFPRTSDDEKFVVAVNDSPVKSIQSKDEEGNWHVAFDVDGASQSKITISGFAKTGKQDQAWQNEYVYFIILAVASGVSAYIYKSRKKPSA